MTYCQAVDILLQAIKDEHNPKYSAHLISSVINNWKAATDDKVDTFKQIDADHQNKEPYTQIDDRLSCNHY